MWKTSNTFLNNPTGYTFIELDHILEVLCSQLNRCPLDPSISQVTPSDFLVGYKSLPINIRYHNKYNNSVIIDKLTTAYKNMEDTFKKN